MVSEKKRKKSNLFIEFVRSESTAGLLLLLAAIVSLLLSNSIVGSQYVAFWEIELGHHSIGHWINDGLMVLFFLMVGLELERELYVGELADIKKASLPIIAAFGGMLVPGLIHLLFNFGTAAQAGAGIPTATDIAFSLAVLSLFSKKVPTSLKVFLTALAIADDLGAIFIIAIFYTKTIFWMQLLLSLATFGVLLICNRMKVKILWVYLLGGFVMWYFMVQSGVHSTITGVLLAFAIPFTTKDNLSEKVQHQLHKPVAFIVLPLFALANTAIMISADWQSGFLSSNSMGVFLGLLVGKPLGILLFVILGIKLGLVRLPKLISWNHIIGASILAGIGFTMSIFVSILAFDDPDLVNQSQLMVLLASLSATLLGCLWFMIRVKKMKIRE